MNLTATHYLRANAGFSFGAGLYFLLTADSDPNGVLSFWICMAVAAALFIISEVTQEYHRYQLLKRARLNSRPPSSEPTSTPPQPHARRRIPGEPL